MDIDSAKCDYRKASKVRACVFDKTGTLSSDCVSVDSIKFNDEGRASEAKKSTRLSSSSSTDSLELQKMGLLLSCCGRTVVDDCLRDEGREIIPADLCIEGQGEDLSLVCKKSKKIR